MSAHPIRQRFESIMQRMGQPVRLLDLRLTPPESLHRGYRTKGAGPEAAWEFRFLEHPMGLQEGSLLTLDGDPERWRVLNIHVERDEGELLFVSATVTSLEAPSAAPAEDVEGHLKSLRALLLRSSLGPLEQDDVGEALERLPRLLAVPGPEAGARIKARLKLMGERFKACPQTAHDAKGQLLKLEALLKRKGSL